MGSTPNFGVGESEGAPVQGLELRFLRERSFEKAKLATGGRSPLKIYSLTVLFLRLGSSHPNITGGRALEIHQNQALQPPKGLWRGQFLCIYRYPVKTPARIGLL